MDRLDREAALLARRNGGETLLDNLCIQLTARQVTVDKLDDWLNETHQSQNGPTKVAALLEQAAERAVLAPGAVLERNLWREEGARKYLLESEGRGIAAQFTPILRAYMTQKASVLLDNSRWPDADDVLATMQGLVEQGKGHPLAGTEAWRRIEAEGDVYGMEALRQGLQRIGKLRSVLTTKEIGHWLVTLPLGALAAIISFAHDPLPL